MSLIDNIKEWVARSPGNTVSLSEEELRFKYWNEYNTLYNPFTHSDRNIVNFTEVSPWFKNIVDKVEGKKRVGNKSGYDYLTFYENYISPEVFFAVNLIADLVAQLPITIYSDIENRVKLGKSYSNYLLNQKPNQYQSSYLFKHKIITNMYYFGVAYAVKINNNTTLKDELHILNYDRVIKVVDDNNQKYIFYAEPEIIRELDFEECSWDILSQIPGAYLFSYDDVLMFKFNDCCDSPLDWLWQDVGLLPAMKDSLQRSLRTSGNKKAFVWGREVQKGSNQAQYENIAVSNLLKQNNSGAITLGSTNTSKIDIVEDVYDSSIQGAVNDVKKTLSEKLGIPFGLMGGESNQGKKELVDLLFLKLAPKLTQLEQEIGNKLFTFNFIFEGGGVEFDTTKLFRMDELNLTETLQKQVDSGFITLNEGRLRLGKEIVKNDPIANKLMPKLEFNQLAIQNNNNNNANNNSNNNANNNISNNNDNNNNNNSNNSNG